MKKLLLLLVSIASLTSCVTTRNASYDEDPRDIIMSNSYQCDDYLEDNEFVTYDNN